MRVCRRFGLLLLVVMSGLWVGKAQQAPAAPMVDVVVNLSTIVWIANAPLNQLNADIEGHHYQLMSDKVSPNGWLQLGTYHARLKKSEQKKPYLQSLIYEIVFDNGDTEDYTVEGESR